MGDDEDYFNDGGATDYLNYTGLDQKYNSSNFQFSPSIANQELPSLKRSTGSAKILFFMVSGISVLGVFLNIGTILLIFKPKKIRPVNYLIANMSFVCILISISTVAYVGDKDHRTFYGVWLCGLMSFVRSLCIGVVSLTVMGISYERIKSLKPRIEQFLVKRTLVLIWSLAVIVVIPSYFTTVVRPDDQPGCIKVAPFGFVSLGIVYEIFRFAVFHLFVSVFMAFELYKVRSKLKYLYLFKAIPSERMRRKVQKVRFVYLYSITFITFWLPMGMMMSFYKMVSRNPQPQEISKEKTPSPYYHLVFIMAVLFYVYFMVTPVIILWTNQDLTKISWFRKREEPNSASGVVTGNDNGIESSEMSRGTTFAKTSDSIVVLSHASVNKCAAVEVKILASDNGGDPEENVTELTTTSFHKVEVYLQEEGVGQDQLPPACPEIHTSKNVETNSVGGDVEKVFYV